jgi:hypothetical protein
MTPPPHKKRLSIAIPPACFLLPGALALVIHASNEKKASRSCFRGTSDQPARGNIPHEMQKSIRKFNYSHFCIVAPQNCPGTRFPPSRFATSGLAVPNPRKRSCQSYTAANSPAAIHPNCKNPAHRHRGITPRARISHIKTGPSRRKRAEAGEGWATDMQRRATDMQTRATIMQTQPKARKSPFLSPKTHFLTSSPP